MRIYSFDFVLDVDECSSNSHSCDVNAVCSNVQGSHSCACKAGYSGDGKTCSGTSVSWKISSIFLFSAWLSRRYYIKSQKLWNWNDLSMYLIIEIDECSTNSHSCDVNAVCSNTPGSHNCTCKAEYSGDGKTCAGE